MRRFRPAALSLLWALAVAAACGDSATGPQAPEDVTFASSLGINLSQMTRLPSGVYILKTKDGAGAQISINDYFVADYKGWIPNGTMFDSGRIGVDPKFRLSEMVPGFGLGAAGMQVGETRKIVMPSDLGYGSESPGPGIPANAVLIFEVTLVKIGL